MRRCVLGFVLLAFALAGSPARAADVTMVLQGPGSITFYAPGQSLTCPGTTTIGFRISGPDFQIIETFTQPAPNPNGDVERQASCAINSTVFVFEGDNATPKVTQCVPGQDQYFLHLESFGIQSAPFVLSGTGSATNPYVALYSLTLCNGDKIVDKVTLRTAPPMSYKHEVTTNGVLDFRSTATPARLA